jgi:hypothetical protein
MSPILVVIPFHSGDADLLVKLLDWMLFLNPEGHKRTDALLVTDDSVKDESRSAVVERAKQLFRNVRITIATVPDTHKMWPKAPNVMFEHAARQVQLTCKLPWLWLEPDSVPLKKNWLDALSEEAFFSSRLFLGAHVQGRTLKGQVLEHMSGVAIYPHNTMLHLGIDIAAAEDAFDLAISEKVLKRMQKTPLIQHHWGPSQADAPTFALSTTSASPKNTVALSLIDSRAVLFHRCKDGSLIELLKTPAPTAKSGVYQQVVPPTPPKPPKAAEPALSDSSFT